MPEDKDTEALLSYEENNALRCTACTVTIALKKKLKYLSNSLNKKLLKYLKIINTIKEDELSGGMKSESENWLAVVGEGDLTHIRNMIFGLLALMDLENDI